MQLGGGEINREAMRSHLLDMSSGRARTLCVKQYWGKKILSSSLERKVRKERRPALCRLTQTRNFDGC